MNADRMDGLDIESFRLIRVLGEVRHFRMAAGRLGISQSTVTQKINRIEAAVGASIWVRRGRNDGTFTPLGNRLCQLAGVVLDAVDGFIDESGTVGRRVVLGVSSTPFRVVLPALLGKLQSVYPDLEIAVISGNSAFVESKVIAGEVDIGLTGRAARDPSLMSERITRDRIVLAASPSKWGLRPHRIRIGNLCGESLLWREDGSATQDRVCQAMSDQGIEFPRGMRCIDISGNQSPADSIRDGVGIGFVSESAAQGLIVLRIRGLSPLMRHLYAIALRKTDRVQELMGILATLSMPRPACSDS